MARGFSDAPGASPEVQEALQPDLHRALIALGHDTDSRVLEALVRNIRTPSSVIRSLAESRNRSVAQLALSRLQHSFR